MRSWPPPCGSGSPTPPGRRTLRDVLVADLGNVEWSFVRYVLLGYLAKRYFCQEVRPGTAVGLCGGFAVSRLVHALERGECPEGIRVSPIAVSPVFEKAGVSANSVVSAIAYRHWDNRETRDHRNQWAVQASELSFVFKDRVLNDTSPPSRIIRRMLTDAEQVDYVFMGVGSPENGALTRKLYDLQHDYQSIAGINEDIPKIKDGGQAVGDILYHLVDAEGQALPHFEERNKQLVCSIGLEGLQKLVEAAKRVVVIATGREKAAVTRAAIRGRYANVLIVDDELARALLQSPAWVRPLPAPKPCTSRCAVRTRRRVRTARDHHPGRCAPRAAQRELSVCSRWAVPACAGPAAPRAHPAQ